MPRSEITTLLPRPMSVSGRSRDRANRMSARSSNPLCAVTSRSAGPPTRIVVSFASGALRSAFTPTRRAMSPLRATRSSGAAAFVTRRSPRRPRRRAGSRRRRSGSGRRSARASRISATASAAPGRALDRAAARHRGMPRRLVEERDRVDQGLGVERLVLDELRRARVHELRGVRPLVCAGVGVRHDDERQPERGDLGEGRRPGAPDDEVGRGQRLQQPLAQERLGPVARRASPSDSVARAASAPSRPSGPVTWMTTARSTSRGSAAGDRLVEPPHGLRAAEDHDEPGVRRRCRGASRAARRSTAATSRIGVPVT